MTTEKPTDILPKQPTEMGKRSRPRMHRSHHPNDFHGEAALRDPTKCRIKRCRNLHMHVQSGFPRAEARSYHGEYDHLLWSLWVRYGSMIYRPRPMHSTTSNGHQQVTDENWRHDDARSGSSHYCRKSRRGPCDDRLFPDITLANPDDGLCLDSTLRSWSRTKLCVESQRNYDYDPESRLDCYRATMAIDNRYI